MRKKRETTAGLAGTFYNCVDGNGLFHRHGGVCGHLRFEQGQCRHPAEGGKQYITQWEDKDNNLCVKDGEGKDIRDREDSDITLTTKDKTTDKTETTSNTVTIDAKEDNTANVTLEDVHIEVNTSEAKSGAIEIKGDGNTNLELNGDNTVMVKNDWHDEHAAIEKADAYGKGTLTIKDDVNDNGTEKSGTEADTTGKLLAGATIILPPSAAVAIHITGNIL